MTDTYPNGCERRRGDMLLFFPCAIATLYIATEWLGAHLFLIYFYGREKVSAHHLKLLAHPNGKPWPVSNGEFITQDHFVHYLISVGCWLFLMIVIFVPARLLLPRQQTAA